MNDPVTELIEILQLANVHVRFGLVAQGHIPTIEKALEAGEQWSEIGKRIGWNPDTAREYYEDYLKEKL